MNPTFQNTMRRIADDARGRYASLVRQARRRTESAAYRVAMGKKPVKTLTGLGLKLTAISHKTADQVLKQQTRMVEHQIDAIAGRLKAAADARNVSELVRTQIHLIPQNVSRLAGDARDTLGIVFGVGAELRDVVKVTFDELRGKPVRSRKAAGKTATTRKTARKKAGKSAAPRSKKVTTTKSPSTAGNTRAAA
jgi:hypothetical protein